MVARHLLVRGTGQGLEAVCDGLFPLPWDGEQNIERFTQTTVGNGQLTLGTCDEVLERIVAIRNLGFDNAQLPFLDCPVLKATEIFTDEVLPGLS